jgi:hypothetical protein
VQAKYCKPLGRCHSTGAGESKHGGPYRFDTKTGYPLNGPPADQALVAVGKAAYVPEWAVSRATALYEIVLDAGNRELAIGRIASLLVAMDPIKDMPPPKGPSPSDVERFTQLMIDERHNHREILARRLIEKLSVPKKASQT